MHASHWSYGWNCHLGCRETDQIVDIARRHGPDQGIYGAKITGGGSGGTVAILADAAAEGLVRRIADEYEQSTGLKPDIFDSTSPGACAFGIRTYRLKETHD
jgi:L-arabinokinase